MILHFFFSTKKSPKAISQSFCSCFTLKVTAFYASLCPSPLLVIQTEPLPLLTLTFSLSLTSCTVLMFLSPPLPVLLLDGIREWRIHQQCRYCTEEAYKNGIRLDQMLLSNQKKREKRLHHIAKVGMSDATLPKSLQDIAFQDSCSLYSPSWI